MHGVFQEQGGVAGTGQFGEVEGVSWGPDDMGAFSHAKELGNLGTILKWGVTGIVFKRPF